MKDFALYTLARLGLFVIAFGLVWLAVERWVRWSAATMLWVSALALVISAIASLLLLGSLRDRLAVSVQERARRLQDNIERSRAKEDVD